MSEKYAKKGYLLEDFRLFHLKDKGETKVDYHYHEFYKLLFFFPVREVILSKVSVTP